MIQTTRTTDALMAESRNRDHSMKRLDRPGFGFAGKRVHLIGIGGSGMSGAAGILLQSGAVVSGSDLRPFHGMEALAARGVQVHASHHERNVPPKIDLVVYSAAIPESNVELRQARFAGCRVIRYAELLGELMGVRLGVAIAGTHGKSTTTALCAHLFRTAGLDPSFVVGGRCPQLGGGSGVGVGPHFIVESCEFNRSFLSLKPRSAAILNIEADHLDYYRDIDEIEGAFGAFAKLVPSDGLLVVNHDDPCSRRAAKGASAHVETFGFDDGATWQAGRLEVVAGRYTFEILYEGRHLFRTSLGLAGRHNVSNALAAVSLAWHAGVGREELKSGLQSFAGVDRRMSLVGRLGGVTVVDDYAHHPTEVRQTLRTVREQYSPKRVWAVFQPHQHSRTRILMNEFAASFGEADRVVVPDIYGSRDTAADVAGVRAGELVDRLTGAGVHAFHKPSLAEVVTFVLDNLGDGDAVVTMGAGDVWKVADALVERLEGTR